MLSWYSRLLENCEASGYLLVTFTLLILRGESTHKRIDPPPFFLAMPVMPIETVACIDKPAEVNKPLLQIKAVS